MTEKENILPIIRPKQLCKILSISMTTLYRWESEGRLPFQKVKVGPNVVGYRYNDVKKWLEEPQGI